MEQVWHDLLFLHWPVKVSQIRDMVPDRLEIDTFKGQAWLGIVPFWMSEIRKRNLPRIPGHHSFPEINVRTYVKHKGQAGVWFLSLDASNTLAVLMARRFFHLPYFRARIRVQNNGSGIAYSSSRRGSAGVQADFVCRYQPVTEIAQAQPGGLEHWLTERYRLFVMDRHGQCFAGDIHHAPWPLQAAEFSIEANSMAASHGIALPDCVPLAHFAQRLEVLIWSLTHIAL